MFLTNTEAVFVEERKPKPAASAAVLHARLSSRASAGLLTTRSVRMQFVGGAERFEVDGFDRRPGVVNHLLGNDPRAWTLGVPTFGGVRYADVWPGIDVVFHGRRERLEYDFEVAASVDHRAIQLVFPDSDSLAIDADGNLVVSKGSLRQLHRAPTILQDPDGAAARPLDGRFVLRGKNRVTFELEDRDRSLPVVVDPEVVYTTPFFGGSNIDNVSHLDVGDDGRVTIAGYTESLDFPGTGPFSFQPLNLSAAPRHAAGVISRLSADGSQIEWTTYLGGSSSEFTAIWDIKVDHRGFTYVCGVTTSSDFPVTGNAFDSLAQAVESFVAVLTPNGASLVYSSFLGGSDSDSLFGLTLLSDPRSGRRGFGQSLVAVTGATVSPDFPLRNAAASPFNGSADAVVAVIDTTGGGLLYSSRIPGGMFDEIGRDIDARGEMLALTGFTYSVPRFRFTAWHHALEDDRGVAQMRVSTPAWTGYTNRWNQLLTKAFTLPAGQVEATFVARWETEQGFDFLRFRVSADDGVTWVTLAELDGFSTGFETRSVDLSAYAGRSVLLQFQFVSDVAISDQDGGIDTNGSAVDSIAVTGFAPDEFETGLDGWVADDIVGELPADSRFGPLGGLTDAFVALVKPFEPSITVAVIGGGGSEGEEAGEVRFAPDGSVVTLGQTGSIAFPVTAGAYQRTRPGFTSLWVAKFSPDLSQLLSATYFGGNTFEFPNGLAIDRQGRVLITGISQSSSFPIVDPIDVSPLLGPGGGGNDRDYIFAMLSPDLSELVTSSKFGNVGWELGGEVSVGPDGSIYLIGRKRTGSSEAGPTQDVFVIKLRP